MKNGVRAMLSGVFAAAALAAVAVEEGPVRILMIGNSFSTRMAAKLPPVIESMGRKIEISSLFIGGCSLKRHWENVEKASDPAFKPYRLTAYRSGKMAPEAKANIPDALKSGKWDIVTIQQSSAESWRPETYEPYTTKLIAKIRELAPQAKIVLQETWSYSKWDGRLKRWGFDQNAMYEKLHAAYGKIAKEHGLEVIPTGTAVQLFRKSLPVKYGERSNGGDVCGEDRFVQGKDGKWHHKGDSPHMNYRGDYLQSLVWAAKLFNLDVRNCTFAPKNIDVKDAALMREVAMNAVKGE